MLTTSILSTCLFQFSHKKRQTMLLYAYFTPKVDFKRKFNHHQSFLYEWRLTARTIWKFRIGPPIRIESRIRRTIRNRIESRSFAGPYLRDTMSNIKWRGQCNKTPLCRHVVLACNTTIHFCSMSHTTLYGANWLLNNKVGSAGLCTTRAMRPHRAANFRGPPFSRQLHSAEFTALSCN